MAIEKDVVRLSEEVDDLRAVVALLVEAIEAVPCVVGAECEAAVGYGDHYRCKFHRLAREAEMRIP